MKRYLLVLPWLLIFIVFASLSHSENEVKINPAVRFQGDWLIIKNNDSFSYDYVKVTLNGKFRKELPFSIPDREEVKYRLSSFAGPDGERFNILTHTLVDVSISCECTKQSGGRWEKLGKGFYYGKFK